MNEQNEIKEIQQKIKMANTPFERSAWQTKLAWHYVERECWLNAGREFRKASKFALAESDSDNHAKLVAAQLCTLEGLAWGNAENHRPEAMRALEQSLVLYESLSDSAAVADVQNHLDSLARSRWQEQHLADSLDETLESILAESDDLLADLSAHGKPTGIQIQIPLLRTQACVHALNGNNQAAESALLQAIKIAKQFNDERLAIEIEAELALLPNLQDGDQAIPSSLWEQLIIKTAEHGAINSQATLLLEQAAHDFGEGLYDDAIVKAQQVRLISLEAFGPKQIIDYFSASMILSSAYERRGDDVDVIDTLLRCKSTLERELGQSAGEPLKEMLNSLLPRWGEDRFEQALRGYRLKMRSAGGNS